MIFINLNFVLERTYLEEKSIPDPSNIIKYYKIAYEHGWNKLEQDAQQELIWFTSKVMQAIQKHWKPFQARGNSKISKCGNSKISKYFDMVTTSNEAFGLFLLKYSIILQEAQSKKHNIVKMKKICQ